MNIISSQQTAIPQDLGIPGIYALLLCKVVLHWGIHPETLFAPFYFDQQQLTQPDFRIPIRVANDLAQHALILTGESSLGIQLGTQMRISNHGMLGYAMLTAVNLEAALMLANRFIQLRLPFMQLSFSVIEQQVSLQLHCDIKIEPLRTEIMLALMLGILNMSKAMTGIEIFNAVIDFDFSKPTNFDYYCQYMPHDQFHFGQAYALISFDKNNLNAKMLNADPLANQVVINQCEAELSAWNRRRRVALQVRELLSYAEHHSLNIEQVAKCLHRSARTLKRQLAAEGSSFSVLADEVRYRYATSLLSRTDFNLEYIADELGYSDAANFSRAFKRWSGRSPSLWRKDWSL